MSILKIVANPADVGISGGFIWNTASFNLFDNKRVEGCFEFGGDGTALPIGHAAADAEMWYHIRFAKMETHPTVFTGNVFEIRDANSNMIAALSMVSSMAIRASAFGNTTVNGGAQSIATNAPYSMDVQVIVNSTITVRFYINGALYADISTLNTTGTVRGNPGSMTLLGRNSGFTYFSEMIIANEDTRGMRVREMRPRSFGIFQEWDGSIASLRDTDLATGISVDAAGRRVSFGVSNIENIVPGDVINRVVAQTYAQRGESGLSAFNHFFRFRNGDVEDGADQPLTVLGNMFVEEFPINPSTGVGWTPEDFRSLQTGLRSRT